MFSEKIAKDKCSSDRSSDLRSVFEGELVKGCESNITKLNIGLDEESDKRIKKEFVLDCCHWLS
jgi:hypothetical protein